MFQKVIKLANELDKMGLVKEADEIDMLMKSAGRTADFKRLLADVLRDKGYTVGREGDPENEGVSVIDIPLNTASDSWGNTNQAWFTFANHVLRMPEIATDWRTIAPSIGRGYSKGLSGMMDLVQDFSYGGRARVGADLGSDSLAEQTDERTSQIQMENLFDEYDTIMGTDRDSEGQIRGEEFQRARESVTPPSRPTQEAPEAPELPDAPSDMGQVARPEETGETTWKHAGWTQVRNPDGSVKHYIDDRGQRLTTLMPNTVIGGLPLEQVPWMQQ